MNPVMNPVNPVKEPCERTSWNLVKEPRVGTS